MWKLLKFLKSATEVLATAGAVLAAAIGGGNLPNPAQKDGRCQRVLACQGGGPVRRGAQMIRSATQARHHAIAPQHQHYIKQAWRHGLTGQRHACGVDQQPRLHAFFFRQAAQGLLCSSQIEGFGYRQAFGKRIEKG